MKKKTVSQRLYKKLQQSDKLIAKKSYSEAEKIMQNALSSAQNDYEKATVLRSLASIHALKGHYPMAEDLLSQSVALNALAEEQQSQAMYDLGQLYMVTGKYQKAVHIMQPWLAENKAPNPEVYMLMANAYTQLEQYKRAIPYIKKAIKKAKKPAEAWYQLHLALTYKLQDYQSASQILQQLIHAYPDKKQYWDQLVSVYQQLKQFNKAASIKYLAYKKGLLVTESEKLDLINLFLYVNSPYKAAQVLAAELKSGGIKASAKNWELLASAWTQAKEFDLAINALNQASKLSDKGTLYLQLGQIHVEREQWPQAISALNKAVQKGNLRQMGNAFLLLGMCHYELEQLAQARQAFISAQKYQQSRLSAAQWLQYLNKQQESENS